VPIRSLEGVRIAAFTQFLLGPAGVQLLADLGADVIKVETPGTGAWERRWAGAETFPGGVSAFFLLANRNLRSLTLNLKSPAGLEAARKLIASSDIVVENFRPGVMDRLGLGYEAVKELRSDIVYVSATGYGANGPYRDLPGQDLLIQAVSGVASLNGRADEIPVPLGAAMIDQHGAALLAMATLAAELHRDRTGEGQHVEVVMIEAAFNLATEPVVYHLNGAALQRPNSWVTDTFHEAPYGIYPTSDGAVAVSMSTIANISLALGDPPELAPFADPSIAFSAQPVVRGDKRPIGCVRGPRCAVPQPDPRVRAPNSGSCPRSKASGALWRGRTRASAPAAGRWGTHRRAPRRARLFDRSDHRDAVVRRRLRRREVGLD
jgi:crotonobetainyl-CoA:carnitine CoA-transferase CaiB-like acyl-CoA transferase